MAQSTCGIAEIMYSPSFKYSDTAKTAIVPNRLNWKITGDQSQSPTVLYFHDMMKLA